MPKKELTFKKMTVSKGADFVMAQLQPWQIAYAQAEAKNPKYPEYSAFSALHDLCDANMILPFAEDVDASDERWTAFASAVMDEVSRRIVAAPITQEILKTSPHGEHILISHDADTSHALNNRLFRLTDNVGREMFFTGEELNHLAKEWQQFTEKKWKQFVEKTEKK